MALSDLARRLGVLPYELFRAFRVAGGYRRCWEDFLRLWREL
ncbi:MAG TPA: hypothetical protein VFK80_03145 [Limnochordia bacterium]|nr:hypothetical protein [Limnochordia bacterium]